MPKIRTNRVVYRFWHSRSAAGRVGYIGKDNNYPERLNLERRKREKSTRKLFRALSKYPLNFWKTEILASGFKSNNSLIKAEIFFIKKFNSKNDGYNCTDGGEGPLGMVHSAETKRKMSKAQKGRKQSPEHIAKRFKSRAGWKPSFQQVSALRKFLIGRKLTKKHKRAIGRASKKAWAERRKNGTNRWMNRNQKR